MLREALLGITLFIGYYVVAASALLLLRAIFRLGGEGFRKMLHIACVLSILPLLYGFETWYLAALTPLLFAAVIYPLITLLERFPRLFAMLEQRGPGEIRSSLILVFVMMAALIAVYWGLLGPQAKPVILVSIMAWGFGDAAAALFGKAYGRHHFRLPHVEPAKTAEGSLAMMAVASLSSLICLLFSTQLALLPCVVIALVCGIVAAIVELYSTRGGDTVTVPLATSVVAAALLLAFGGIVL